MLRTDTMKVINISKENNSTDEIIIKNQNDSPAVTANDLNLGEEEFISDK